MRVRCHVVTGLAGVGLLGPILFGVSIASSQLIALPAQAQLMDQLKGAVGGGPSTGKSSGGGLTGALPSVNQASPSNTAGVLQYCVRNNYVSAGSAASVKDSLLNKVSGSNKSAGDAGFSAGNKGELETGNGQNFSLSGGAAKAQVTKKVCDLILQRAKSML